MSCVQTLPTTAALQVQNLNAWYDESQVLHGVTLKVNTGEVVTILGRNGAGRTSLFKAIMGLLPRIEGSIRLDHIELTSLEDHDLSRHGIGLCPEDRGVFATLTCKENLDIIEPIGPQAFSLEQIYSLFPNIYERQRSYGGQLSGGEQQMLALARLLRMGVRILLLDEVSEGLAPVIVDRIAAVLRRLKREGFTLVLAEQNFKFASTITDRYYVMENGHLTMEFTASEMTMRSHQLKLALGV